MSSKIIMIPNQSWLWHDHALPVQLGNFTKTKNATSHYNPADDYMEWHRIGRDLTGCFEFSITVTHHTITHRFWNFREEITTWVDEHCVGPVLLQRQGEDWKFHFLERHEISEAVNQFVGTSHKHHRFDITIPAGVNIADIDAWLGEHVRSQLDIRANGGEGLNRKIVWIRDSTEATHFRLRWADHLIFHG